MSADRRTLTVDEAIALAHWNEDSSIHCFANPAGGMLVGADWERGDFVDALLTSRGIEVGGDQCRALKHAIVVWISPTEYRFFAHDEARLVALEGQPS